MYKPTVWQDEVVEFPYRYTETTNSDGTIEHKPAHGQELKAGTPQSATNFNHMEGGIHDNYVAGAIFMQYIMQAHVGRFETDEKRLGQHDEEFSAETGEVTLTNSNKVFFAFNNSGSTVSMKRIRKTMNYDLDIEVVEVAGGQLGEVVVYDKQLNGFKLRFTGSAKTVKVKYKIRGGMYA